MQREQVRSVQQYVTKFVKTFPKFFFSHSYSLNELLIQRFSHLYKCIFVSVVVIICQHIELLFHRYDMLHSLTAGCASRGFLFFCLLVTELCK